jgi:hypothetical protein
MLVPLGRRSLAPGAEHVDPFRPISPMSGGG